MKNQIIFLSLMGAQSMQAGTLGEEHTLLQSCLKQHGGNVKVCMKLIKHGYKFNDREKLAVEFTIKLYLSMLASYHDLMTSKK